MYTLHVHVHILCNPKFIPFPFEYEKESIIIHCTEIIVWKNNIENSRNNNTLDMYT